MSDAVNSSGLSKRTYAIIAAVALVSLGAGYALSLVVGDSEGGMSGSAEAECEDVLYWYDPMVPGQRFDEPGKSPFMDMMLVPKCAGEAAES